MNSSIILPALHSIRAVNTSCVQRFRWAYTSREFSSGRSIFRASSRAVHKQGVAESLRREGVPVSRQGQVWEQVQRSLDEHGVSSRTASYQDATESASNLLSIGGKR